MPIYKKLVRDRIPEVIEAKNKRFSMRVLESNELEIEIKHKLLEEVGEYKETTNNEEAVEVSCTSFTWFIYGRVRESQNGKA
ncbi:MAG: hypothetical protein ACE3JQ_03385 [Paenisporosarcina sp.]